MTKGRWVLVVAVVALVGFATVQGLRPKPPPPVEVTTSVAKKGTVTRIVTAAGHLQARETVKVSSNVTGDLLALSVKEGDRVERGQVLGHIGGRQPQFAPHDVRSLGDRARFVECDLPITALPAEAAVARHDQPLGRNVP